MAKGVAIDSDDARYRTAAFEHLRTLMGSSSTVTRDLIALPFFVGEERLTLVDPQRGIHKPRAMRHLLSITTVVAAKGRKIWYEDQTKVHQDIYAGDEGVFYSFMGQDAEARQNQWMREAADLRVPIIYFLGVKPGLYQPLFPVFLTDWDARRLNVRVVFGVGLGTYPERIDERRYAMRSVKQRLHQVQFREAVIEAYQGRCAISNLCEPRLLDAAHIIPDGDELGVPVVQNGLPLSKLHHAAYDANLIGIDGDGIVHVSRRLLEIKDGPLLEQGLKAIAGRRIGEPVREIDRPDRALLDSRFQAFRAAD